MKTEDRANLDELVWGAKDIAAVINRSPQATYHMLETGLLSADKFGNRWVSTRRRLIGRVVAGEAA